MVSIGINMGHPCVLCDHGSKVEIGAERLKKGNIGPRVTIFGIPMYFGRQIDLEWSHLHHVCNCVVYGVSKWDNLTSHDHPRYMDLPYGYPNDPTRKSRMCMRPFYIDLPSKNTYEYQKL